ncbi:hypothetical protein QL285_068868 [Trifolium repens]|nr:hypothetical protein QL285_068868 [Trifolium repens]
MAYSNPLPYYSYPTTVLTFSPFSSPTIPPTYLTPPTIPNQSPHPNTISAPTQYSSFPTFPSYPYHTHTPQNFTHSSHYSVTNSTTSAPPNQYIYQTFPSYPSHNQHSPYYSVTNNTTSPPSNPYSTSSTPNTENGNCYQQQVYHSSQPPVTTFQDHYATQNFLSKISEIAEKYKQEEKESQRIFDEKMQVIRLDHKEKLQKLSDKYTTLKKSRKEIFVVKNPEKDVEEEAEKFVDGGSDFFLTDQNLEIVEKEHKEEKEQESETHNGFLLTSLCSKPPPPPPPQCPSILLSSAPPLKPPDQLIVHSAQSSPTSPSKPPEPPPELPDLKYPSETASASPPVTRPPSKPPDAPSFFLPLAPLFLSTSLLFNSLLRPPDTVLSLLPVSPPPPEPPDLDLPPEIFLPTLPALPRPSPKPPYPYTTVVSPPLMFIFQNHRSRDLRKDFTTSDQILAFKNASRLLKENSIRVILYELIMYRHVAVPNPVNMQRPKTVQFFTRLFIRLWLFNIICNQLGAKITSLDQLSPIQQIVPFAKDVSYFHMLIKDPRVTITPSTLYHHHTAPYSFHQVHSKCSSHHNTNGSLDVSLRAIKDQIFVMNNFCLEQNSHRSQVLLQFDSFDLFGPPHTRPARKPPD